MDGNFPLLARSSLKFGEPTCFHYKFEPFSMNNQFFFEMTHEMKVWIRRVGEYFYFHNSFKECCDSIMPGSIGGHLVGDSRILGGGHIQSNVYKLGGGFKYFLFSPLPAEDSHFD